MDIVFEQTTLSGKEKNIIMYVNPYFAEFYIEYGSNFFFIFNCFKLLSEGLTVSPDSVNGAFFLYALLVKLERIIIACNCELCAENIEEIGVVMLVDILLHIVRIVGC